MGFQCVYKGLKLIVEALRDYLMMKKQDCFTNKQDSFLKAVLCMFGYGKLHGRGMNEFGTFWDDFGMCMGWIKREETKSTSQA